MEMQVGSVASSVTVEDATGSPWFHDRITGTAEDAETLLSSEELHGDIRGMTLTRQLSATAVEVIELESVRPINLVPSATGAVRVASREKL